ncbi:sensor histidine kinase [Sphingomonas koreensis]|uniref:ATP-binding protein n=1 Tax=Sphingomonas koreensis TaxID=93064 RepID=UPI000836C39A|nr:ATP-binding protein [Sphingomonas koreensis]PJI88295.1 two-component system sensor histidine kinase RegB [Sphingomonas koreensis]RSU57698.1 sensor histidine kinase [Sphingomonas koreensis]RSU65813.1 sensor histidine kinase [Sphingomonas koreensis]
MMDAPLLALTRRGTALTAETAAAENMRQLIQLRWIAVGGQTLAILLVRYGLGIPLPVVEMLGIAAMLAIANLLAMMALPRHQVHDGEVMVALLIDMAALTLQLYFSGGATNPFISLYLLQVVLGAILLPPLAVAVLVVATACGYALLTVGYVPLELPADLALAHADLFAIGHWVGFVMVAWLLVQFIVRISRNLRARDANVADLRQHAAEEEGIVRMGLFASGAAHELGTPLSTLSVILADWRRVPAIAGDPRLAGEVEEMQAEVQRCKAIVSDILHSAGQPRGEAMESMAAAAFLTGLVEAWQPTWPQVPIVANVEGAGAATIAVDPALRQAVTNLLDNAAEASPLGLRLTGKVEEGMLEIIVRDYGLGFDPAALAHVGELYRSTKGAGHGLGLFLATNVARRMGGRIEARNPAGGGAEVRLILPLIHDEAP